MSAEPVREPAEYVWTPEALNDAWFDALSRMGVPFRFSSQVPVTLPIPPDLTDWMGYEEPSSAFLNGRPWAVTFLGPAGTGKTWSAVRLLGHAWGNHARNALYRKDRARFVSAGDLVHEIRNAIGTQAPSAPFDEYVGAPCLLLDDLGAERATDFAQEQLSLLLSQRYNSLRPTIITCNAVDEKDLYARMDPRIADRLVDGRVYAMQGDSRRGGS